MTYSPPHLWPQNKPERVKNWRRKALYTCKSPWDWKGKGGENFVMPCRQCGSCMGNRKNDLIGRMIAESLSCWDVWVCTLTYDDQLLVEGEKNGAQQRCTEHIRAMIHSLRMQGQRATGHRIDLTYFAVYEKGEKRGRGHWHIILFWKTDMPAEVLGSASVSRARADGKPPAWMPTTNDRYHHPEKFKQLCNNPKIVELRGGKKSQQYWNVWPHGRVTVDSKFRANGTSNVHGAVEYCVKYVTKQKQRYLMSHGMGKAFYMQLIAEHVNSGIPLNDLTYSFADQFKMPQYRDRLKQKRSDETGGNFNAIDRRRVYQIQGVMRDRCLRYAVRLHRQKMKRHFRELLPRRGLTVRDALQDIKDAMSLQRIGSELVVRQWERMRFNAQSYSAVLDKLQGRYEFQCEIADEMANAGYSGGYRQKNRIDGYSDAFRQPTKKGPAMVIREQALMKR